MTLIGTLPGERLAGLSADLFHKLQSGSLSIEELALFVQRKNPFSFERNKHSHIVVTVMGLDITGAQEIALLEAARYRLSDPAKSCLLSTKADSYDGNHRLVAGREYKVALMPGREIEKDSDRTTENLRKRGMDLYGYGKPLAGIVPRIREAVSDKQLEEMGVWYVAALHDPIKDSGGAPLVLVAHRSVDAAVSGGGSALVGAVQAVVGAVLGRSPSPSPQVSTEDSVPRLFQILGI